MSNKGLLVIYSGCSGVGKGTLVNELKKRDKNIWVSVSNTTRKPRVGELDGVHYNFVTKKQFEELIEQDGYMEYACYCGDYYGTPKGPVEDMLSKGRTVLLEIEVQGGLQIMKAHPDITSIFVLPPSMEALVQRLHKRGTEDDEAIQKRLKAAEEELTYKDKYKYNVINDELSLAVDEILDILKQERAQNK